MGAGVFGKLVTGLLIIGEASVPLYFAFSQTMRILQEKLFEDVLREQGVFPVRQISGSELDGDKATIPFMSNYLRMRGIKSYDQQMAVADSHKLAYRQFGIAAALLSAVPVASWAFAFSNTVGAALWAADLEKRKVDLFK
ncbi:hypothetical protein WJX79_000557 [Trebouxia sp. C0005]